MRLLILSFFAALLGYSLLFDRGEVQPTDDLQESSASSVRFTPIDKDTAAYSFMDWLSIMPNFPSLCMRKQDFVFLK
ncbi:MAG: hypothetical protein SO287_10485 [Parabacteroides sp.]|nr:hypothetical protein [Parabacteroides sp.]MCI7008715.1 hypothetical protein [Parabacteroides sp.]MDD6080480.1 hypothetical protein [bacterium]MDD7061880.1 hypothetical protein [bacterium]MDY4757990.1 hypothetical protein [Parabacteroides sp.]